MQQRRREQLPPLPTTTAPVVDSTTNLVGTLVSVLARISLLRSGRTSETLHELPDQQRDSDQEQIRKESTYNHHMGGRAIRRQD